MKKTLLLIASHLVAAFIGFSAGIYVLPILTAPLAPTDSDIRAAAEGTQYTGEFQRDLKDSDALHWGEGSVFVGEDAISMQGRLHPDQITISTFPPSSSRPKWTLCG